MIIIKNKTKDCFARIPNLLLHDNKLKWKDKGLLAYLLSKPEGWKLQIQDILNRSPDGKDSVYNTLKNLIKHGYCLREDVRDQSGKLCGVQYSISDSPMFADNNFHEAIIGHDTENPHTENPHTEKPTISKKEISKTELLDLNIKSNKSNVSNFPWAEVMQILKECRPSKPYRSNPRGATDRSVKSFWRRHKKDNNAFRLLCTQINASGYLMGKGGFEGEFPNPNPNWSWVFGKTNSGEQRSDKIINGDYSDEKMSFLKKNNNQECLIIGKGKQSIDLSEKLANGNERYQSLGIDEYTGLNKYYDKK
jgi:hypothetical protein